MNKTTSEFAGMNYGEAVCQAIWIGNAQTQSEAFATATTYIEYQSIIEDINMATSLFSKYGEDHPIVNAFFTGVANQVLNNCGTEYNALP